MNILARTSVQIRDYRYQPTGQLYLASILLFLFFINSVSADSKPAWVGWDEALFNRAKADKKLVLLDLEAIWCHWCHVMEQQTYANKEVSSLLSSNFITVRVDKDSRPDLAAAYGEYGWPATIIFNAEGAAIRKLSGYIEAQEFTKILKDSIQNPKAASTTEITFSNVTDLPSSIKDELTIRNTTSFDRDLGGLRTKHKYLEEGSVEFQMLGASLGEPSNTSMAQRTLHANLALIDPVWGGVYQYSTGRVWTNPHFEKIASTQARNMRLYAKAYSLFKYEKEKLLQAAQNVERYVRGFMLSPEGAFYTSQDADLVKGRHSDSYFKLDDKGRRALGIPSIDKNIYARENGWLIYAYAELYAATADLKYLETAKQAANWIIANRSLSNGGFKHSAHDNTPYLSDTLYMGVAFLSLYTVTSDRVWLSRAEAALSFIVANFIGDKTQPGFLSMRPATSSILKPTLILDDNLWTMRLAISLFHYTGKAQYRELARLPLPFISTKEVALKNITEAGILIADYMLNNEPTHITIVGPKDNEAAKQLFLSAVKYPAIYQRVEWWDKKEGPMPNPDVQYPELSKPAAFVCTNKRCSLPIFKPEDIGKTADKFARG